MANYDSLFDEAGKQFNVDPALLKSMMLKESSGNPTAVSPKGATGLMQLMPGTAQEMGVSDLTDPRQNIFGGAKYMSGLLDKYGDVKTALAAYNAGPGAVDKHGGIPPYPETQNYVKTISQRYQGTQMASQDNNDAFSQYFGDKKSAPVQQKGDAFDQYFGDSQPVQQVAQASSQEQSPPLNLGDIRGTSATEQQPVQIPSSQQGDASFGGRFLTGLADPFHGGAQLLAHALPTGVVNSVNQFAERLGEIPLIGAPLKAIGIANPQTPQQLDQMIAQRESALQEARKAAGQEGIDWARGLGNVVSTAPIALAAPYGSTLARGIASGALTSAGTSALMPVTEGDYGTEKTKQVTQNALLGGALGGAGNAVAKVISPNVRPQVQTLMNEGVTPTPGQILGGRVQATEEKLTSVPLVGDMIKNAQSRALDQFQQAAYKRALAPIGEKVTEKPGYAAIAEISDKLGSAYNNLLPKLQFKADQPFLNDLSTISQMAMNLPPQQANRFQQIFRDYVFNKMTPQGNMSGTTLKAVESDLGTMAKAYQKSSATDDRLLGDAFESVQKAIRDNLTRSNPEYAKELSNINTGYANYVRLRQAAGGQGAAEGIFTPKQLNAAVRGTDQSVAKGDFARGKALMQDLSSSGVNVLSQAYPDSGTAGRSMIGALLAGGAAVAKPELLAGAALASAPYTSLGQKLAAAALTQRPAGAQGLAEGLRRITPAVTLGAPAFIPNRSN